MHHNFKKLVLVLIDSELIAIIFKNEFISWWFVNADFILKRLSIAHGSETNYTGVKYLNYKML